MYPTTEEMRDMAYRRVIDTVSEKVFPNSIIKDSVFYRKMNINDVRDHLRKPLVLQQAVWALALSSTVRNTTIRMDTTSGHTVCKALVKDTEESREYFRTTIVGEEDGLLRIKLTIPRIENLLANEANLKDFFKKINRTYNPCLSIFPSFQSS